MSEISRLKRRARKLYVSIWMRANDLDCGWHMATTIRPGLVADKAELDRVLARLREIDPDFPNA